METENYVVDGILNEEIEVQVLEVVLSENLMVRNQGIVGVDFEDISTLVERNDYNLENLASNVIKVLNNTSDIAENVVQVRLVHYLVSVILALPYDKAFNRIKDNVVFYLNRQIN